MSFQFLGPYLNGFPFVVPTCKFGGAAFVEGVDYGAGTNRPLGISAAMAVRWYWYVKSWHHEYDLGTGASVSATFPDVSYWDSSASFDSWTRSFDFALDADLTQRARGIIGVTMQNEGGGQGSGTSDGIGSGIAGSVNEGWMERFSLTLQCGLNLDLNVQNLIRVGDLYYPEIDVYVSLICGAGYFETAYTFEGYVYDENGYIIDANWSMSTKSKQKGVYVANATASEATDTASISIDGQAFTVPIKISNGASDDGVSLPCTLTAEATPAITLNVTATDFWTY